jgi:hypothetical protein
MRRDVAPRRPGVGRAVARLTLFGLLPSGQGRLDGLGLSRCRGVLYLRSGDNRGACAVIDL